MKIILAYVDRPAWPAGCAARSQSWFALAFLGEFHDPFRDQACQRVLPVDETKAL
jgi:hypothetical protein